MDVIQPRALILLPGEYRQNDLEKQVGRSVLDLPLGSAESVLSHWVTARTLIRQHRDPFEIRLIIEYPPERPTPSECDGVTLEAVLSAFRGPAGLLRNAVRRYAPEDWVLAADAGAVAVDPDTITALLSRADEEGPRQPDAVVFSHASGLPVTLVLIRVGVLLEHVPELGFNDLKEQALPNIVSRGGSVVVLESERDCVLPITDRASYLRAIRRMHREDRVSPSGGVAVIEGNARVDDGAVLHDSVVFGGSRVHADTLVARSIVCSGEEVEPGTRVCDVVVGGPLR